MCSTGIQKYGSNPIDIQWNVIRGDTANLTVEFLESDEETYFDTTGWAYRATSYDASGDVLDNLEVSVSENIISINIPASVTKNWGTKYSKVVAELPFDLQVFIPSDCEDTIWTPIIGTIRVLGDVSPGGSL